MKVCQKCGGNCDSGELIGGICIECAQKEQDKHVREKMIFRFVDTSCYQEKLNLEEMGNG